MKESLSKNKKYWIGLGIVFLGTVLLFAAYWIEPHTIEGIFFHLMVPADGTNYQAVLIGIGIGFPVCLALTGIVGLATSEKVFKRPLEFKRKKTGKTVTVFPCRWLKEHIIKASVCFLVLSAIIFVCFAEVPMYLYHRVVKSTVFDEYCVVTDASKITFPENKKNLVYIVLESVETDYADEQNGGEFSKNRIPRLTELAKQNTSFSNTTLLGGAYAAPYADWSTASLVAQTSGLPCKTAYTGENDDTFLENVTTLYDILDAQNYYQCLLMGFVSEFAAVDLYMNAHGTDEIFDYNSAIKTGYIPADHKEFWGFEDRILFEKAKEKLTEMSQKDTPFALTMVTMDTHFFGGYECPDCEDNFIDDYSNAIYCSDKRIGEFIDWMKTQPFYEDTVIVLCGDHPTMDPWYLPIGSELDGRPLYNCIINSSVEAKNTKNREFTVMDMFPTTLTALGASWDGDRLAMGTDLFSDTPTLCEEIGTERYFEELLKRSEYFDKNFSGK